ncbi:uncharacterized protein LOC143584286 isoform X2 [Bidens hawaiensis]
MCILCVIQKWSRKVATMLPWLVIPLLGLWLLSQFLPPTFRFEITSPRLACVLVLLATLFWYEILMPQLSSWRARRNARLKEKKRLEAIEMLKLRKTATRRCRNCKTPYRDQNPAGAKFMCCYCGHSSKRPLFDPCVSPGLEQSGVLKDMVGKVWSDNNWICGQDWLENGGYWVNGSFSGKSSYLKQNNGGLFNSGNDHFFSFLFVFVFKSLAAIFLGFMWPFRKLFRISFSEDDGSSNKDINGLAKKAENGLTCNETRSEKARRKAEEKRQARLEREQLEEEERKQREEVARLVEERRKLRDETDKKAKASTRDRNDKIEVERKRQERKKEKDIGSSKSNSDANELEKRAGKETERKLKGDADFREHHKPKVVVTNNYNKGSVGARYLDCMRGNFFQSSKTITGGFFGNDVNAKANVNNTRELKSSPFVDHSNKRDFVHPERAHMKSNAHADGQTPIRPVVFESQPCPPPKRSWHQLFTRSSPPVSSPITNVISRPNPNESPQTESQNSIQSSGYLVTQGFDNPVSYRIPFPPLFTDSTISTNTNHQFSTEHVHREPEIYEDPCFVADPVSLIGPVSDSLDNFPIDLGFLTDVGSFDEKLVSPRTREMTNLPQEDHGGVSDKGWQMWNTTLCPDVLGLVSRNSNWCSPKKVTTSDDSWALRSSYGSASTTHKDKELVYGIPNGSGFNHPFQPSNDSVWAK